MFVLNFKLQIHDICVGAMFAKLCSSIPKAISFKSRQ